MPTVWKRIGLAIKAINHPLHSWRWSGRKSRPCVLPHFLQACASTVENNFGHCERVVKNWALSSLNQGFDKDDKYTLKDLLYFLHVPRTGGRSYYHCFLKTLFPSSQECPRSYDKLRFEPGKSNCRLLATHNDYSMMQKLPKERTSVVTMLRNPVDRVLSVYEYSIEVAARFLIHPDIATATKISILAKKNAVSALNIWPWNYLITWMRADLFARRDARRQKGSSQVKSNSPYDMEDILMPLHEFIDNPIVHDNIHNGATFQIAGLTNNSNLVESHGIRHCVQDHKSLSQHVLRVAKKRLDAMLYVGLTAELKESVAMFANVVGAQVILKSQQGYPDISMASYAETQSVKSVLHLYSELDDDVDENNDEKATVQKEVKAERENMTIRDLIEVSEGCMSSLRKTFARRQFASLKMISPANFSKEARSHILESVRQRIRTLNYMDLELLKYAQNIFSIRRVQLMRNLDMKVGSESKFNKPRYIELWKILSLVMLFILLLFLFLFKNARRRVTVKV